MPDWYFYATMLSKGNFERKRHKQRFVSYMCQTLSAGNGLPHDYEHRDRCALARAQAEPRNTFSVRVEVLVCAGQHVSQERNNSLPAVCRAEVQSSSWFRGPPEASRNSGNGGWPTF